MAAGSNEEGHPRHGRLPNPIEHTARENFTSREWQLSSMLPSLQLVTSCGLYLIFTHKIPDYALELC